MNNVLHAAIDEPKPEASSLHDAPGHESGHALAHDKPPFSETETSLGGMAKVVLNHADIVRRARARFQPDRGNADAQLGLRRTPMVWAFFQLLWARFWQQNLTQVAAGLTFTTVLSLVPLATTGLAVLTAFPMFERMQADLQNYLFDSFFPPNISDTILHYVGDFSAKAKGLTAMGVVFLFATALSTMLTVDKAFNRIWKVHRPRSLVNKVVLYWAVVSLAPLLLALSLTLSSFAFGGMLASLLDTKQQVAAWRPWVLGLTSGFLTTLAFAFLYRTVPNRWVYFRDALAGGLLAALLFEGGKRAFAAYMAHIPSYTELYGALAAVPIFLLWLYLSWIFVLLGATVAAVLPMVRAGVWHSGQTQGQQWVQGLSVLAELEKARASGAGSMGLEALTQAAKVAPDDLDGVLNALVQHGLVGCMAQGFHPDRYALICDPTRVSAAKVAKALWFDGELLPKWQTQLPYTTQVLGSFYQDYLENTTLADWLYADDDVG